MIKVKVLFLIMLGIVISCFCIPSNAQEFDEMYYVSSEKVEENINVDINEELANILKKSNVEVKDNITYKQILWIRKEVHHYYYSTSQYRFKITGYRRIDYDIDSVIYMVKQIENYAEEYAKNNKVDKKEIVLNYLRQINQNYVKGEMGGSLFSTICGNVNNEFVKYVDDMENNKNIGKVKINDYFNTFVCDNPKYLIDPLNDSDYIDLIHMMCILDGYYVGKSTYRVLYVLSWAGDLQTACQDATKYDKTINKDLLFNLEKSSKEDIIADIDGVNIGAFYINNYSVSESLSRYYSSLNYKMRKYLFIHELGKRKGELLPDASDDDVFENEVYYMMGVRSNGDGGILVPGYHHYLKDTTPDYRLCIAKNFIRYIYTM